MHRLRTNHAIYRFRAAAFLLCAKCLLCPVAGGILIYSIIVHDNPLTLIAMGTVALCILITVLQWLIATRTNCPLCITPVLANKACVKSRHAKSLFGSYPLRVAVAVLLKNSFRCPYCNEPTVLEVRNREYQPYSKD